jgi:hypothetical protein
MQIVGEILRMIQLSALSPFVADYSLPRCPAFSSRFTLSSRCRVRVLLGRQGFESCLLHTLATAHFRDASSIKGCAMAHSPSTDTWFPPPRRGSKEAFQRLSLQSPHRILVRLSAALYPVSSHPSSSRFSGAPLPRIIFSIIWPLTTSFASPIPNAMYASSGGCPM